MIHVVFSTKDRRRTIPTEFQPKLCAYVAGICRRQKILIHAVGGTEAFVDSDSANDGAWSKAVLIIKSNSSRWANQGGQKLTWQEGYAAFSVSGSVIPAVVKYIENQQSHHRKMSFDEEFVVLLKKHGMEFDSQFVFGWSVTPTALAILLLRSQPLRAGLTVDKSKTPGGKPPPGAPSLHPRGFFGWELVSLGKFCMLTSAEVL